MTPKVRAKIQRETAKHGGRGLGMNMAPPSGID
jgi:hypothetical protein